MAGAHSTAHVPTLTTAARSHVFEQWQCAQQTATCAGRVDTHVAQLTHVDTHVHQQFSISNIYRVARVLKRGTWVTRDGAQQK